MSIFNSYRWLVLSLHITLTMFFGCLWQQKLYAQGLQPFTRQLIIVMTSDWSAVDGSMQRYQWDEAHQRWLKRGHAIPVVVGKHGLVWGTKKLEGDARTPAGIFKIGPAFGFDQDAHLLIPYMPLTKGSVCVDDERSHYYNQIVDRSNIANPDWRSAEQMRSISVYRWGSMIQYNSPLPIKGAGSCIFLHIWHGSSKGTAGCIAMPASELKHVLQWLDPACHPLIMILPKSVIFLSPRTSAVALCGLTCDAVALVRGLRFAR